MFGPGRALFMRLNMQQNQGSQYSQRKSIPEPNHSLTCLISPVFLYILWMYCTKPIPLVLPRPHPYLLLPCLPVSFYSSQGSELEISFSKVKPV